MALWRNVPDAVETSDITSIEFRVAHCLTDPLNEEVQSPVLSWLICEAIDVDHWQVKLAIFALPDSLVCLIEGTNEAVKELNCVHRQVHHAMVELQEVWWDRLLFGSLISLVDKHPEVLSGIHVEWTYSILQLIELDVLFEVFKRDGVQIVGQDLQLWYLNSCFNSKRAYTTEHVAEDIVIL